MFNTAVGDIWRNWLAKLIVSQEQAKTTDTTKLAPYFITKFIDIHNMSYNTM